MGKVIRFISKSERERIRLIREARAIYDGVFPPALEAAHADGLRPIEAKSIDLGEVSGVAYYTVERDGFHVVTTLEQGMARMPAPRVSRRSPGQSVVLSTPPQARAV